MSPPMPPKSVRDLTDAELCREGAEAMGWEPKQYQIQGFFHNERVTVSGWFDRKENELYESASVLLTDPVHVLSMLWRIEELGFRYSFSSITAAGEVFHRLILRNIYGGTVYELTKADSQRAILMALVAAYHKHRKDKDE